MKLLRLWMWMALASTMMRGCSGNMTKRIPPGDPGNLARAPPPHWYPLGTRWYPLDKRYPLETCRYPLEKRNLARVEYSRQFHPCYCLQITKKLYNQSHSHHPASILIATIAVWNGYQRIHKGGWALESCSNNDLKPPLLNSIGTKRDASGWVWGFLFL